MRTLKRGRRRSLGLSMVELMLALAVMIIALFAIMTMILHATRSKESQRELSIAKEAVHQRLDELRSQTWTQLSQVAPPSTAYSAFTVEGLSHSATADGRGQGTLTVVATRPDPSNPAVPSLIEVEVRVQWRGVQGDGDYSVRTLLTR